MQFLGISDNITNLSWGRGLVPHPSVWISCRSSAAVHLPFFSPGPGELSWKGKDHNSIRTTNINFPTVSGTKEPHETASLIFFAISPFSIVMIWKHSTRNNKKHTSFLDGQRFQAPENSWPLGKLHSAHGIQSQHLHSKPTTLPETNSSPLKIDGWNTIVSFWNGLFSGANCFFQGGYQFFYKRHLWPMTWQWIPEKFKQLDKPFNNHPISLYIPHPNVARKLSLDGIWRVVHLNKSILPTAPKDMPLLPSKLVHHTHLLVVLISI